MVDEDTENISLDTDVDAVRKAGEEVESESLQFFLSFDLADFTAFKIYSSSWSITYNGIVGRIIALLKKHMLRNKKEELTPWKTLGDELIFKEKIKKRGELVDYLRGSFDALHEAASKVEKMTGNLSSVKATAWICFVDSKNNVKVEHEKDDYIGPHMDQGFRIAHKFSKIRQLALSAELAYLAAKTDTTLQNFYILGYDELKGVWKGNYYPIIWFSSNEAGSKNNLPYDEIYRCKYTKTFMENINDGKRGCELLDDSTFIGALEENKLGDKAIIDVLEKKIIPLLK